MRGDWSTRATILREICIRSLRISRIRAPRRAELVKLAGGRAILAPLIVY